jgi:hypothetical protein
MSGQVKAEIFFLIFYPFPDKTFPEKKGRGVPEEFYR